MIRKLVLVSVVALLCLAVMPGTGLAAGPHFTAGAPGIGDPYFPGDGNGGYDVTHYDLQVTYDPDTDNLTGVATISATTTQDLSAFNLDFIGLNLREVKVDGAKAKTARDGQELTVTPKSGIKSGKKFTVVAKYDGVPETLEDFGLSGFIHTGDGAIAIGEPHVAATWFPANDHPRDKASFTIAVTIPADLEGMSNGILTSHKTKGRWTTWSWDEQAPMATYLAFIAVGQFDVRSYQQDGIKYWDAIDSVFMGDQAPAITPDDGDAFLYSQVGDWAYKRLTHVINVPAGGADVSFRANRDTEQAWDHLFVETHTVGADDWTTLPDENGHTSQDVGACPGFPDANPFVHHYLTEFFDEHDPADDVPVRIKTDYEPNARKQLDLSLGGGAVVRRYPLRTDLYAREDDLEAKTLGYVDRFFAGLPGAGADHAAVTSGRWFFFISEKVVAITQGRSFFIWDIKVGRPARVLSRYVTRTPAGIGLGSPFTMQLAIEEAGLPRVLYASAGGFVGKLIGRRGLFYDLVGGDIRAIDGPTEYSVYPANVSAKLGPKEPDDVAARLSAAIRARVPEGYRETFGGTVVMDANDIGRNVLGKDAPGPKERYEAMFADNPLGQGSEQTPMAIVFEKPSP